MDESQSGGGTPPNAADSAPAGGKARGGGAVGGGREWAGWVLLAVGAVLCVLGWYGVSGERFVEQQVPYLASSTVPGAALIVSGALLLALRPSGGFGDGGSGDGGSGAGSSGAGDGDRGATDRRVERLYELLVEPVDASSGPDGATPTAPVVTTGRLALPEGTRYHRPDCPLIAGKSRAVPVDERAVRERGLTPCPLCDPGPGEEPGAGPGVRPGEAEPADG